MCVHACLVVLTNLCIGRDTYPGCIPSDTSGRWDLLEFVGPGYAAPMKKTPADYPRMTVRMNQETLEEIAALADKKKISSSKVVKQALAAYLKKHK